MYKYVHGGDIYNQTKKVIDFSANINPLGMPAGIKKAIKKAAGDCAEYPDPFCRQLVKKIAKNDKIPPDYILCGNGAADLLFKLALALKPKKTLLLAPTFADYEKAFKTAGSKFEYYTLQEKDNFALQEDILNKISNKIDLIVLCNPNNPTGQVTDRKLILKILTKAKKLKITVLVDECFLDFVEKGQAHTMLYDTSKFSNLIILKAFTKIYAMAGVRLGYLVTSNLALIDSCRENSQDWSVSTLAQMAGIAALDERGLISKTRKYVAEERAYLIENLNKLKCKCFPGKANYILFKNLGIENLAEKLLEKDIVIRKCENYHNLDNSYFRIAVKSKKENKKFIKILQGLVNQ